ncbi:MAG TPA: sigma 54-interacting transcriptional regulator [Anaerovoracaceae bacterium]|nr:sigma 54-interacting transcriptional regulator [Anaerovoracaceae bacterium]
MFNRFGHNRVLEPNHVLSTSAWKIDNNRKIHGNELRLSLRKLHIENTSFKQICIEADNNPTKIKDRIIDIVIRRGKLHNPVTDTGGVVYGIVEEIGSTYKNDKGLKVGDEVICNASLAAIPLYISHITNIDMAYSQVDAEGYAILFNEFPVVKPPADVPINLLLYAYNESGTLYAVNQEAKGKRNFLLVGNNLLTNLLFGCAVRKATGHNAQIVCLFDKKSDIMFKGKAIDELLKEIFNEIHYVNILRPLECLQKINAESLYDMSINCADIPGAETVNVLATRYGGTVFFANLINNYNIAVYITESISRQLNLRNAEGYLETYDEFDISVVRDVAVSLQGVTVIQQKVKDDADYPLGRPACGMDMPEYRKSLVEDFICESRAMAIVLNETLSVAKYDCNVLITGDTGVGKEKIASIIQKNSSRKMQPFVKINCASISKSLIESELFGYERGSFTGANPSGKKGYFELADNGIIFLDEVGELPLDVQAKLLRVIQDGEFYRVGGSRTIKTNVRIISATNRNLEEAIENKKFRRDLYYRLNVFPIRVPSLSERRAEIPALVIYFINKYNDKFQISRGITEDALEYLKGCDWLGNIRELENVVQRLLITVKGEDITAYDVMKELHQDIFESIGMNTERMQESGGPNLSLTVMVENLEKNIIRNAYEKYGTSRKAAKAIGISQTQFIRKKNKYQI